MTFSEVAKYNTHQEFDFIANNKNFRISSPQTEIKATILQNGRWDNAKIGIPPLFVQSDNLIFDYQDTVVFEAGKQFRYVDLRSHKILSERVRQISRSDTWDFELHTDISRANSAYLVYPDANGSYIIANDENIENDTRSDYINAHFSLAAEDSLENTKVYLYGSFTDWQIRPEYRLKYSEVHHGYQANILLKQGYYNYLYATVRNNDFNHPDFSPFEGNWFETENDYYIFIYYRQFGARYDRVIGVKKFNSSEKR
jgi:hypothetical protein